MSVNTRRVSIAIVCGVCVWTFLVACAQPPEEAQELQSSIRAMQERLEKIRQAEEDSDTRTRRIGKAKATSRDEQAKELTTRIYDVGDLFAPIAPYVAEDSDPWRATSSSTFAMQQTAARSTTVGGGGMGGGMGGMGGGGGFFHVPETIPNTSARDIQAGMGSAEAGALAAARTSLDDLTSAIQDVISPDEWEENGGRCRFAVLGSAMLISATKEMHEQIDQLLDVFRRRWGTLRTVTTELWWVWLTPDELQALIPMGQNPQTPIAADAWAKSWAAKAGAEPAARETKLTGYNGQTVFVNAGETRTIATSWTAVPRGRPTEKDHGDKDKRDASELGVELIPAYGAISEGMVVQATPLTSISGKYATLDIHSRIVEPVTEDVDAAMPEPLRRKSLRVHRLSTTTRLPVGEVVFVGGSTFDARPKAGAPRLYLFARLSMQELRDERAVSGNPMAERGAKPPAPPSAQPENKGTTPPPAK